MLMRAGETPVPIPNTKVKTCAADDTMLETVWESRWVPTSWGCSSVGRAPALQAGGHEFESHHLHLYLENCIRKKYPINNEKSIQAWLPGTDRGMLAFRRLWMEDRKWMFDEYPRTSELVRECLDTN